MRRAARRLAWCLALALFLTLLSGVALSYARSTQSPGSLFHAGDGAWLDREHQPPIAVTHRGVRYAMSWSRSPVYEQVQLLRPAPAEWDDWAAERFPTPDALAQQVNQHLARRQTSNFRSGLLAWHDRATPLITHPPAWATFPPAEGEVVAITTAAYGWPVRVLRVRGQILADPVNTWAMKSKATDGLGTFPNPHVAEPAWGVAWKPIWPGLALNVLALALPAWLLWSALAAALAAARARWRRAHARCPHCGYDAHAAITTCPECGKATNGPSAARTP